MEVTLGRFECFGSKTRMCFLLRASSDNGWEHLWAALGSVTVHASVALRKTTEALWLCHTSPLLLGDGTYF